MGEFSQSQSEVARSIEFFTNPESYKPFELDAQQSRAIGCIDPRDQETERQLRVVVQTAGGAAGEGTDAAIAFRVSGRMPNATIKDGLSEDLTVRHTARLCAHHACKFIGALPEVLEEMAEPSDFTEDAVRRWSKYYEVGELLGSDERKKVAEAARDMHKDAPSEADLLDHIDRLYPDASNVVNMRGENNAKLYVVNHHPFVGLDREQKHREERLEVHGYHDSLAASLSDLWLARLPSDVLRPRVISLILRAAAVRTLIGGVDGDTTFLEVQQTPNGPQVTEVT